MFTFEERLFVQPGIFDHVKEKLARGEVAWVILSGKMCSGKDTAAELLELPGTKEIISYGNLLREDLQSALNALKESRERGDTVLEQVRTISKTLNYSEENSSELLALLLKMKDKKVDLSPWSRSNEMREVLQLMGSDWLPDPDYLPRRAALKAVEVLENGNSVIAAGSRFLSDVEIPRLAGGVTLRLDVTRDTQLRRLWERDKVEETPALLKALEHPGEKELDDFPHDLRVNNDKDDSPEALEELREEVQEKVDGLLEVRRRG